MVLKKYETSEQVLCDMQCNMMQGDGNTQPPRRKTNTGLSGPHQVIERGPWCAIVVNVFRIVLMERVLLKRMIMTSANGRFVLRMPCFFPC